jgi:hypothetical protein
MLSTIVGRFGRSVPQQLHDKHPDLKGRCKKRLGLERTALCAAVFRCECDAPVSPTGSWEDRSQAGCPGGGGSR